MFLLTVYLPLRIRDYCASFLGLFARRGVVVNVLHKLLTERALIGMLPDGNRMLYPLDDFKLLSIISEIYHKKIYDLKEPKRVGLVLDVGAHIGLFTLRTARRFPNSEIIAIEPNPTTFRFLVRNVLINGMKDRVRVLNLAAGRVRGKTVLWLSRLSRGDSSIRKWHDAGSAGSSAVHLTPLDDILLTVRVCDLIKVDVEGMEEEVLKGLQKQYIKVKRLIMEVHLAVVHATKVYEWLANHDFAITRSHMLYADCLVLEARRNCA
jgi:FkbM family methyltransferase